MMTLLMVLLGLKALAALLARESILVSREPSPVVSWMWSPVAFALFVVAMLVNAKPENTRDEASPRAHLVFSKHVQDSVSFF
jgi:hypothetical protein